MAALKSHKHAHVHVQCACMEDKIKKTQIELCQMVHFHIIFMCSNIEKVLVGRVGYFERVEACKKANERPNEQMNECTRANELESQCQARQASQPTKNHGRHNIHFSPLHGYVYILEKEETRIFE